MVWHSPEDQQRSREDWWRAGFIWGVLGLLVAAALGAQAFVPRALEVELGPVESNGRLSVQMPAGWKVSEAGLSTITAESGSDGREQLLKVCLMDAREQDSLLETLAAGFAGEPDQVDLENVARRVKIGGRPALLVALGGAIRRGGREVDVQVVRLAFEPARGTFATVELQTPGDWNTAAEVVVQQVARTIRVASQEQP